MAVLNRKKQISVAFFVFVACGLASSAYALVSVSVGSVGLMQVTSQETSVVGQSDPVLVFNVKFPSAGYKTTTPNGAVVFTFKSDAEGAVASYPAGFCGQKFVEYGMGSTSQYSHLYYVSLSSPHGRAIQQQLIAAKMQDSLIRVEGKPGSPSGICLPIVTATGGTVSAESAWRVSTFPQN